MTGGTGVPSAIARGVPSLKVPVPVTVARSSCSPTTALPAAVQVIDSAGSSEVAGHVTWSASSPPVSGSSTTARSISGAVPVFVTSKVTAVAWPTASDTRSGVPSAAAVPAPLICLTTLTSGRNPVYWLVSSSVTSSPVGG